VQVKRIKVSPDAFLTDTPNKGAREVARTDAV
jgi:hypothetical protein